ncbi:uncharacterized protein H6S33_000709 [Morchella sextelata]|uniref:uncharacterized protein n=1 Tax=Morchella sextelata TaxID=1174677 RepID=UPI001D036367|nr:uncharacterized protein H6S33_000709 [Morchella sextelata]KAH0615073.1 hypothetical protein H6S33_000709 [Morchella sextelata]
MKIFSNLVFLTVAVLSSALIINASPTTRTARIVTNKLELAIEQTNDVDELVSNTNLYNMFVNAPLVGIQLAEVICTLISLSLTLTNTDNSFSSIDSEEIFKRMLILTSSQNALMDRLSGRFGLLSSFSYSEPVRFSIVVLATTVQQLAENTIRLIPARKQELEDTFMGVRKDYQKVMKNYSGYKRAGDL